MLLNSKTSVVLITGASSGIGRALARQLAPRAKKLILVARRTERLEALGAEFAETYPALTVQIEKCDLSNLDAARELITRVQATAGPVDLLVNSAGVGNFGVFDRADWTRLEQMLTLNMTSLALLTHHVLPAMVERKNGGIMNISSGFGLTFSPGFAAYIGTKNFVSAFSESLRLDLAGTGVTVTHVCPGPVATEFEDHLCKPIDLNVPKFVMISAEQCASASLAAFDRGRAMVIPGLWAKFLMTLGTVSPRFVLRLFYYPFGVLLRRKQELAAQSQKPTRAIGADKY